MSYNYIDIDQLKYKCVCVAKHLSEQHLQKNKTEMAVRAQSLEAEIDALQVRTMCGTMCLKTIELARRRRRASRAQASCSDCARAVCCAAAVCTAATNERNTPSLLPSTTTPATQSSIQALDPSDMQTNIDKVHARATKRWGGAMQTARALPLPP
jgi:hypothetical protein